MNEYSVARWLVEGGERGADDEAFVETFIYIKKMMDSPYKDIPESLDKDDIRNAIPRDISEFIKDYMDTVLASNIEEYDYYDTRCHGEYSLDREMDDMYPYAVARWLTDSLTPKLGVKETNNRNIKFAATMVLAWKMHNNYNEIDSNEIQAGVSVDDMRNADTVAITNFIGNCLDEIIFSPEIDSSAWWKEGWDAIKYIGILPDTSSLTKLYLPLYDTLKELSFLSKEEIVARNKEIDKEINSKLGYLGEYAEALKTRLKDLDKDIEADKTIIRDITTITPENYNRLYDIARTAKIAYASMLKRDNEPIEKREKYDYAAGLYGAYSHILGVLGRHGLGSVNVTRDAEAPRILDNVKTLVLTREEANTLGKEIVEELENIVSGYADNMKTDKYLDGIRTACRIATRETALDISIGKTVVISSDIHTKLTDLFLNARKEEYEITAEYRNAGKPIPSEVLEKDSFLVGQLQAYSCTRGYLEKYGLRTGRNLVVTQNRLQTIYEQITADLNHYIDNSKNNYMNYEEREKGVRTGCKTIIRETGLPINLGNEKEEYTYVKDAIRDYADREGYEYTDEDIDELTEIYLDTLDYDEDGNPIGEIGIDEVNDWLRHSAAIDDYFESREPEEVIAESDFGDMF